MKNVLRILVLAGIAFILIGCGNSRHATCDAYSEVPVVTDTTNVNG